MKKILSSLLALVLAFGSPPSFAAYAQLKPPPGWSQGLTAAVPGQVGTFAYGLAANGASFKGTTVLTNAALSVAGQYVTVPVAMRVAANAATTAAEYSFGNPYFFAAALAAPIAYKWFKDNDLGVQNGVWGLLPSNKIWGAPGNPQFATASDACAGNTPPDEPPYSYSFNGTSGSGLTVYCVFNASFNGVPDGVRTRGSVTRDPNAVFRPNFEPVALPQFKEIMKDKPIPDDLPLELPAVKWPVQLPITNPNPNIDPLPAPAAQPLSRPLWVPTGDPVASSPATNPQTWIQPGQNVVASPTPTDPWRVNVEPLPKSKTNATPNTGPETVPEPVPNPSTNPGTPTEIKIETCGLPGKPACLIDETGTPQPKMDTEYDQKLDDYTTKTGELTDKAKAVEDKSLFGGWSSLFFAPPVMACTGYELPRGMGTIDPCPVVDGVRAVMAYIWALTGLLWSVRMVREVM